MKHTRIALMALATAAAACTEDPIRPTLEDAGELQIRPAQVRAIEGDTVFLQAVAFDPSGRPVFTGPIEWSSLDTGVLTVNDSGVVSAVSAGWGRVVARAVDGTHMDTAVIAVGLRLVGLSGGDDYACGWSAAGFAWCWGAMGEAHWGVLGTGALPISFTPAPVAGGLSFSVIAAGYRHTCGIAAGRAYCWGYGAMARGSFTCQVLSLGCHTPEPARTDAAFQHIAVTRYGPDGSTCASGTAGLICWGAGSPRLLSVDLTGLVALGYQHGCALAASGYAYCWGDNTAGQLGRVIPARSCADAACSRSSEPLRVATAAPFVDLAAGVRFTCGLTAAGEAVCWGMYGEFPWSPAIPGPTPVAVGTSLRFEVLEAGTGHVCGLTREGGLYCWGGDARVDELGEPLPGESDRVREPRAIAPGMTFTRIGVGSGATCAIRSDGPTLCVGQGSATGQGWRLTTSVPLPLAPPGPLPDFLGPIP